MASRPDRHLHHRLSLDLAVQETTPEDTRRHTASAPAPVARYRPGRVVKECGQPLRHRRSLVKDHARSLIPRAAPDRLVEPLELVVDRGTERPIALALLDAGELAYPLAKLINAELPANGLGELDVRRIQEEDAITSGPPRRDGGFQRLLVAQRSPQSGVRECCGRRDSRAA